MDFYKNKRRTRAINFRLSEEEFRELKRACAVGGARSVSDFARTAVWRMVIGCVEAEPGAGAETIELRLAQLEQQLSELAGLIRQSGNVHKQTA
jgi:hypothetical protein